MKLFGESNANKAMRGGPAGPVEKREEHRSKQSKQTSATAPKFRTALRLLLERASPAEHRGWPTCREFYEASCWGLVQREGMLSVWGMQRET